MGGAFDFPSVSQRQLAVAVMVAAGTADVVGGGVATGGVDGAWLVMCWCWW